MTLEAAAAVTRMKAKQVPLETSDALVTIVWHRGWSRFVYWLFFLVVVFTDGSIDSTGPSRDVVIIRKSDGVAVYRERGYYGGEALVAALTFIEGINKYGLSDYVFRRSHSWSEE